MTVDVQSPQFGLGELLGATFRLLKLQFVPLLKAFLPLVGLVVVVAGLFAAGVYGAIQYTGFYNPQKWDSLPMMIQMAGIGVTVIGVGIVMSIMMIALFQVTVDSCEGQPFHSSRDILRRAWGRVAAYWKTILIIMLGALILMSPIILVSVMMGVLNEQSRAVAIVAFVLMLLAIPIMMAAAIYVTFTMAAVAVRGHSGMAAIRYSYSLVKGRFWKTLGYVLILSLVGWAIAVVPMFIIQIMVAVLVPIVQGMTVATIVVIGFASIFMLLLQLLFQLFFYIGHTIMFLRWESSKANSPPAAG